MGQDGDGPTRRLFFALWPDDETRAALATRSRKAVRRSGGRPVPPDNYHITLAFLGNQAATAFDGIARAGASVVARPFDVTLDLYGYWPKPRVFWLGAGDSPPALDRLVGDIWRSLASLGIEREVRPFRPHITLARKVTKSPEVSRPDPLTWHATSFALIESVTDRRGAVYTVAQNFPL